MNDSLFIDLALPVADRSSLENCSECPRMARAVELGVVQHVNFAMSSGCAAHDALGETIDEYVSSQGQMGVTDLADFLVQRAAASRPDLQPDVLKALRFSAWPIAKYLNSIHFANVLRWDGGQGEHSGQMTYEMADLGWGVTSEVDLLHAGPSPVVIHETDFKTGNDRWSLQDVADSFQFQTHALLGFKNYPDVEAIEIGVWNTRLNQRTYPVLFKRENLYHLEYRVHSAMLAWIMTRDKSPEECEPWPGVEKCQRCPFAAKCDCTRMPGETPEQILDKLVGLNAQADALQGFLEEHIKRAGADLVSPLGNWFGFNKPKRRGPAPKASVYQLKAKADEPEET